MPEPDDHPADYGVWSPLEIKAIKEYAKAYAAPLLARVAELERHLLDMQNALWKACGDDTEVVRSCIESQGGDPDAIDAALAAHKEQP